MIKEVTNINHFEKLAKQWNSPQNQFFWRTQSCRQGRNFDPDSIEKNLKSQLIHSLANEGVLPYIKIWSYEIGDTSIAGCVFGANFNFMMSENIFEEVLWQMPGKFPSSIGDKKVMIELLRHAENYAKQEGFKVVKIGRDPALHNFTREKNSGINNYYTRNNYEPASINYFKTLN